MKNHKILLFMLLALLGAANSGSSIFAMESESGRYSGYSGSDFSEELDVFPEPVLSADSALFVDEQGYLLLTPIVRVARSGDGDLFREILKNPNISGEELADAYTVAARSGHQKIITMLLDYFLKKTIESNDLYAASRLLSDPRTSIQGIRDALAMACSANMILTLRLVLGIRLAPVRSHFLSMNELR